MGREIVVVMGVGFVGAVMAGVVADSVHKVTGGPMQVCHRNAAALHPVFLEDPISQSGNRSC